MNDPQLSIVIVNWNTRDLVLRCVRSIYANEPTVSFEIIIVDNGSSDDSVPQLNAQFPDARIIFNYKNLGFSKAINQGIFHSKGEYILLLNSDTIILPNSIDLLFKTVEENSDCGIVGGKLLNPDHSFQSSYNDFPTLSSELISLFGLNKIFFSPFYPSYPPHKSNADRKCDWVGGAFLMARKKAIDEVGYMDEDYFMYAEEVDWCYRMKRKEWDVIYCSDAEIIHLGGGSAQQKSSKQLIYLYHSKSLFLMKHQSPNSARIYRTAVKFSAFVKSVFYYISSIINENHYAVFKNYWELFQWDWV